MRTSSALCQDILCGPEVLASRPLDMVARRPQPMFAVNVAEGHLSGLLSDRTLVDIRWIGDLQGPWELQQHQNDSFTFASGVSQCSVVYSACQVPFTMLGGNPHQAAQTLLKYLTNARNGDPRVVQINEKTTARLSLDVLELFGWTRHEHHYEPPQEVDQATYSRAAAELELIIEQFEGRAYPSGLLFDCFHTQSSMNASPPQITLGITSADGDEQIFDAYTHMVSADPKHTPHYFEALHEVAGQSEYLQVKYMEQESLGVVALGEIKRAYNELGLHFEASEQDVLAAFLQTGAVSSLQKIASSTESGILSRALAAVNVDYAGALRLFGASYQSDEALIASRAKTFLGSPEPLVQLEGRYALLQIAQNKRSGPLLALYENYFPSAELPADPYGFLSLSPHMDDQDIVTAFELISGEEPVERQLQLRLYLKAIAQERGSKLLLSYLEKGALDEPAADFPVGLWNIGNTCYLNSLLQFYNTLMPFKAALKQLDAQKEDETLEKKKVGGRHVPWPEVQSSQQFLGLLSSLFEQMATTKDRFVLPSEQLAYMALVPPKEQDTTVNLHAALERQQDVTEIIENVLYQFESGVNAVGYDKGGEQQDLVKELFYGTIKQSLQKEQQQNESEATEKPRIKEERINGLMVSAEGPMDIYSALDGYFAEEQVELENSQFSRTVSVLNLPPILQIQIQRVQFNRRTYEVFKNNAPITLPETLYMDRYFDTEDAEILAKRKERLVLQAKLKDLEARMVGLEQLQSNRISPAHNLATCAAWLKEYGEESLLAQVKTVIGQLADDIETTKRELGEVQEAIAGQFDGYKKHGYRIHSLFIHRGQVNYGHYWIYIRDFEHDRWLKYNDETVTQVEEQEVFDYSEGNTATPYFLVYVREDYVQELKSVDRREPESVEPESVEPESVEPESVEPEQVEPEQVELVEPAEPVEPALGTPLEANPFSDPVQPNPLADPEELDAMRGLAPSRPVYQRALSSKLMMKPMVSPRSFALSALDAEASAEFVEAASTRGSALHTPRQSPPPDESV